VGTRSNSRQWPEVQPGGQYSERENGQGGFIVRTAAQGAARLIGTADSMPLADPPVLARLTAA